ncbi:MAG: GNAT family N-acetyltransferase [Pseudomonadota bacterium]
MPHPGPPKIRPMRGSDTSWLLALNRRFETELSPLDATRLAWLQDQAFATFVAVPEAGMLITFDQGSAYDSPNFLWFKARYERFAYIDRVAVDPGWAGRGVAAALYEAFFAQARAAGHSLAVCEVNAEPPNPGSDRFHARLGFEQVGEAALAGAGKKVRYFAKEL